MTDKSWITITVAGARAGICVAGITYFAAEISSRALAESSRTTIEAMGSLVGAGAEYAMGSAAGLAVRIASKTLAHTTKESIAINGKITSGIVAAAAGAVTALSITAGSHVIQYTIEYGGKISKEMAVHLSEMYLKYKAVQSGFTDSGNIEALEDDDWVVIDDPMAATELQTFEPKNL